MAKLRLAIPVLVLVLAGCSGSPDSGPPSGAPTPTPHPIVALDTHTGIPEDSTWHDDGARLALTVSDYPFCSLRNTGADYDEEIVLRFAPGPAGEICTMEVKITTYEYELAEPVDVDDPPPVVYVFDDGRGETRTVL